MSIDIEKFKNWLTSRGCEILPNTNEWELLRFKGMEVGVLYTTGKTNSEWASKAIIAFVANSKWEGSPLKTGRRPNYKKQKGQLLLRDGDCCFFCGQKMEDNITVEHLIALSCGGNNTLSNMVLAHEKCNKEVSNMPISEKVKLAIKNRKHENN